MTRVMRSNIVKLNEINSVSDLNEQLDKLNSIRSFQEEMIIENFKAITHSLQPGVLLKKALHKVNEDSDLKKSALQTGLDLGARFLLDKILLRKGVGIKGYLLNLALKKVASLVIAKRTASSAKE